MDLQPPAVLGIRYNADSPDNAIRKTTDGGTSLKDKHGNKIGEIREMSGRQMIYDKHGNKLGGFDRNERHRDKHGNKVGSGNLLTPCSRSEGRMFRTRRGVPTSHCPDGYEPRGAVGPSHAPRRMARSEVGRHSLRCTFDNCYCISLDRIRKERDAAREDAVAGRVGAISPTASSSLRRRGRWLS